MSLLHKIPFPIKIATTFISLMSLMQYWPECEIYVPIMIIIVFIWFILRWHANKITSDLHDIIDTPYKLNKIILSKPETETRKFGTYHDPNEVSITADEVRDVLIKSKQLSTLKK